MTFWLIEPKIFDQLSRARERGESATEIVKFEAAVQAAAGSGRAPSNYTVDGTVGRIEVRGALTKAPDFWAWLLGLGNTTYRDIQGAFALAESDARVQSIELEIDSPGGQVDGLFETIATIRSATKPIKVRSSLAASAAYALAAAAGATIQAVGPASMFGSIGVVASFSTRDGNVDVTSTEAPEKRPDIRTEEGRAVVRKQLDGIHELFVDAIAAGRGVSTEKVNSDFGRGATLLAGEAKKRGMIDSVVSLPPAKKTGARAEEEQGTMTLTLETLKVQHPDLVQAIRREATTEERERVVAHLELAEGSGDVKTAHESIRSGEGLTQLVTAKHMKASMVKKEVSNRQKDSEEAESATKGAGEDPTLDGGAEFSTKFNKYLSQV